RTGDLASLAPDGSVVVEGRLDHVVKRRGVKVSLPAIEAASLLVPAVDAAAAVVQQGCRIVLYCGVSAGSDALSLRAIRMALLDTLAPAQLPDKILVVTRLPLDRRAKVDRAALRNGTTGNS
ncbi:MAG: peptide synthetase, partial [Rhodococcus sp. (in: high G+C Gram-positive bacteria)]